MAIRVEHQPAGSAIGVAAYAAGLGQRKERQQKYAMMQWETEQRRIAWESKYSGSGTRSRRRLGGGEEAGTWTDPLTTAMAVAKDAKGKKGTGAEVIRIRAQQRANDRRARLGKGIKYPEAEPQFERAQTEEEKAAEARLRAQEERFKATEARQQRIARANSLPEIPKWITDPNIIKDLTKKRNDIRAGLIGINVDFNDPGQAEKIEEEIRLYESSIEKLIENRPDQAAEANANLAYRDPKTGKIFNEWAEGLEPGRFIDGQFTLDEMSEGGKAQAAAQAKAEDDAKKAQEKAQEKAQTAQEKRDKELFDLDMKIAELENPTTSKTTKNKELIEAYKDLRDRLKASPLPATPAPAAPAPAASAAPATNASMPVAPATGEPTHTPGGRPVGSSTMGSPSRSQRGLPADRTSPPAPLTPAEVYRHSADAIRRHGQAQAAASGVVETLPNWIPGNLPVFAAPGTPGNPVATLQPAPAGGPPTSHAGQTLPMGAIQRPDGTVEYQGVIYRRQ